MILVPWQASPRLFIILIMLTKLANFKEKWEIQMVVDHYANILWMGKLLSRSIHVIFFNFEETAELLSQLCSFGHVHCNTSKILIVRISAQ